MEYQGEKLSVALDAGVATLCFDAGEGAVNKFDRDTLAELEKAIAVLQALDGLNGLIVRSARRDFIVGADIAEFGELFRASTTTLRGWLDEINALFSAVEDLDAPSVSAVAGTALGGGLEMALATDYRVASQGARLGFPESQLGILPGFGGLVRAPRLVGADNAVEWMTDGQQRRADTALTAGMVDAVVADDQLDAAARDLLARAMVGEFDWRARRAEKTGPLKLNAIDAALTFETAQGVITQKTGGWYPAPGEAVRRIAASADKSRAAALAEQNAGFVTLAQTREADALIQLFLNNQLIKRKGRGYEREARPVARLAVLGAGIMGGGIAYQAAYKGVSALVKDIQRSALDKGVAEAGELFGKAAARGKIDATGVAAGMARIQPALSFAEFDGVDAVIEAVVEDPKSKRAALAEAEASVADNTVIASNTSSIAIATLASGLQRPANFLGMHFFNPVHRMPLVEVVRGEQSSDTAVATVVNLAHRLGKTPVVVGDCPGFLVNRILFPYFFGCLRLIGEGADFAAVDRAMERFGWPMGPAHLLDVVGMDTAKHVETILAEGYPDRMATDGQNALDIMVANDRLGQKSGAGFYDYATDAKGRPQKTPAANAYGLLGLDRVAEHGSVDAQQAVDRLMVPMIIEAARALEASVVATPHELDTAVLMGLGFPAFRGGVLKYADARGLTDVCQAADACAHLGPLYQPTAHMRELARNGGRFYS